MLDIAEELDRWVGQGREFAVATVVAVGGSAPRQPGPRSPSTATAR